MNRLPAWIVAIGLTCVISSGARPASAQDTPDLETAQQAWEKCKAALEAKGEHLNLSYFIPAPVPDDKNFALTPLMKPLLDGKYDEKSGFIPDNPNPPINSVSALVKGSKVPRPTAKSWMTGDTRPLDLWQAYYREALPDLKLAKSPAEDVLAALARFDVQVDELRASIATHPVCRYPLGWDKGVAMALPHLTTLQSLVTFLGLRASSELELNQPDKALSDLQLAFRLIDTIRGESTLIDGLVRITAIAILLQPIHDGIAAHRWNEQQLAMLEKEMQAMDFLADYEQCMRTERGCMNWLCEKIIADPAWLGTSLDEIGMGDQMKHLSGPAFKASMYENQILINTMIQNKFLVIMDTRGGNINVARAKEAKAAVTALDAKPTTVLAKTVMVVHGSVPIKFARMQVYLNEAITACEIERYRLAHGKLPTTLDEIRVANLPHDIINGQPLHYKPLGDDNYLLYSVGWNETDDGGKIAMKPGNGPVDYEQGDWVWTLKPMQ